MKFATAANAALAEPFRRFKSFGMSPARAGYVFRERQALSNLAIPFIELSSAEEWHRNTLPPWLSLVRCILTG